MDRAELNEIIEAHKKWLRGEPGGKRAKLSGAVDFAGADLTCANFARASLVRANLAHAKLDGASLVRANLAGAVLDNAKLAGANFTNAVLPDKGGSN